jgi:hypothetical protein
VCERMVKRSRHKSCVKSHQGSLATSTALPESKKERNPLLQHHDDSAIA